MHPTLRYLAAAVLALLTLAGGFSAPAQQPRLPDFVRQGGAADGPAAEDSGAPSPGELEELAQTLRDPEARRRFLDRLDTLIAARREGADAPDPVAKRAAETLLASARAALDARLTAARDALGDFAGEVRRVPASLERLRAGLADPDSRAAWSRLLGRLVAVLLAGLAVEATIAWLLRRPCERLRGRTRAGAAARTGLGLLRALMRAVPVAAFGVVALAATRGVGLGLLAEAVALLLIQGWVAARLVMIAGRFILAPQTPELRPVPLDDTTAAYLTRWLRRLSGTAILGFVGLEALARLGFDTSAYHVLQRLLGLGLAVALIVFVTQVRGPVARWLRGPAAEGRPREPLMRALAEIWHVLAALFVAAVYAVWALEIPGGFRFLAEAGSLTVLTLTLARGLHIGLDRGLARCLRIGDDLRRTDPDLTPPGARVLPTLRRGLGWLVNIAAAVAIAHVWGAGTLSWLGTALGREVAVTLAAVLLTGGAAVAAWEGSDALIARRLARSRARDGPRQAARMATLLPLVRNLLHGVIVLVATIVILPELGVNIGPLLAGAGVIGIAVGFGAQTLVKDVITGIFILVENSLAVGDWVEIGGHSGEVQALTIRTVSLRDLNGYVHIVPFAEVTTVLNMTRDHGYALVDIPIAYREDVDAVTAIVSAAGEELREDPAWGPLILGPLEVFGLERMTEAGMEVRVRMKTRPLMHWAVRRELLRRAKTRLDAAGIALGVPHRTLEFTPEGEAREPAESAPEGQARATPVAFPGGTGES